VIVSLEMRCSPTHFLCLYSLIPFAVLSLLTSFSSKIVDDIVYEVDCQLIQVKKGADIDIGWFLFSSTAFGPIFEPLVFFFTL